MALVWRNYNFRIYPNVRQIKSLNHMFDCTRFVYNHFVELGRKMKARNGRYPNYNENMRLLQQLISEYDFLQRADSESLPLALHNLDRAYQNHASKPGYRPPAFKSIKHGKQSYMTRYQPGTKLISAGKIHLPIVGSVKIAMHRLVAPCFRPTHVTITRRPSGQYTVSIALYADRERFEKEVMDLKSNRDGKTRQTSLTPNRPFRSIGLDFSVPDLIVDSNGDTAGYPHFYRQSLKRIALEQRKLSLCKRDSSNYRKQRIKVAKLIQKSTFQRLDYQHKLSRNLANQNNLVCIEDLSVKRMVTTKKLGKSVYDDSWYRFTQMLAYKLNESRGCLQKVGRWYPSSRICSRCGSVLKTLTIDDRVYHCSCGYSGSRDVNAAINIQREGLRLSQLLHSNLIQ